MPDEDERRRDDGLEWGHIVDGEFRPLPKLPMLRAGLGPPPFHVKLYNGTIRHVVHRPAATPPQTEDETA